MLAERNTLAQARYVVCMPFKNRQKIHKSEHALNGINVTGKCKENEKVMPPYEKVFQYNLVLLAVAHITCLTAYTEMLLMELWSGRLKCLTKANPLFMYRWGGWQPFPERNAIDGIVVW